MFDKIPEKTTFHTYRIPKAQEYEKEVFEKLKRSKFIIVKQGLEHTHPEFHKFLTQYNSNDPTSLFNRYQPDNLATQPNLEKTCFIEVKHSNSIEKDAYLTYKKIHKINCNVLVCIKDKWGNEYWVPIEKLKTYTATETKESTSWDEYYPIDKDDWFAPRLWANEESKYYNPQKYYNFKNNTRGSGTSFRYFNFSDMKEFKFWAKYRDTILKWLEGKEVWISELEQKKLEVKKGMFDI